VILAVGGPTALDKGRYVPTHPVVWVVILAVGGPTALAVGAPPGQVDDLVVILAVGGPTALVVRAMVTPRWLVRL
jgi:hypothetical protein